MIAASVSIPTTCRASSTASNAPHPPRNPRAWDWGSTSRAKSSLSMEDRSAPSAAAAEAPASASSSPSPTRGGQNRPPSSPCAVIQSLKILLIEDDSDLADALAEILIMEGYRIVYASDGMAAL